MEKNFSAINYLSILVKKRKFIIKATIIISIVTLVMSFILTPLYTATTTVLPPNLQQNMMFGLLGGGLSPELSALTRMGGLFSGISNISDIFAAIIKSSRVMGAVINKYELKKVFKAKTGEDAMKALNGITKIRVTSEGIISVSVTYKDKFLAANIANSLIEELDKFVTSAAMTTGKKYRIFIEQRLAESERDLKTIEDSLKQFQEKHRTVALNDEVKSAIETIAKLKGEIIFREVQKNGFAAASNTDNPYIKNIDQELKEMKRQLAKIEFGTPDTTSKEFGAGFSIPFLKLPGVSLEYARLLRDVKIKEAVYELLTEQYEQAKIMELKDTPTVQVLDSASPPERKSWPRRGRMVITAFFLSLIFSSLFVFITEYFNNIKKQPEIYMKLTEIINILRTDYNSIKFYTGKILRFKDKKN